MKSFARLAIPVAFLLAACGDEVTQINQTGLEVYSTEKDLPKCTDKNEGEQALVKGEASMRVCFEGTWYSMPLGAGNASDFSCTTKELKDGSGLKIVCNGDSIGVVLNGSDGKNGKNGKDGSDGEDGKDAVLPNDTLDCDSECIPVSLDSLAGYSQKGPFLKGSTVYLYELNNGYTLKQTNGNFTSYITRDDGRYKFTARDMISQYAMIVVDGYYRNEVTGEPSNAPIRLRALTNLRKHSDANINLLTTLEFDRVYHLVTLGDKDGNKLTVKQAKKQAQNEILKAFHIELDENTDAEDLNVFGKTDADAALLAISILMQGEGNETDLSVLLTEISNDMEADGTWDDSTARAKIADWAATVDTANKLGVFRSQVAGWGLGDSTVPYFEKIIRKFWSIENRLGECGDLVPVGTVRHVANPKSEKYYAKDYTDTKNTDIRFICVDADSAKWRPATNIEKDTIGQGKIGARDGKVVHGKVNKDSVYVLENGNWRHGTALDTVVEVGGCIWDRRDTVAVGKNGKWYKCDSSIVMNVEESSWKGAWREATTIEMDTATWGPGQEGDIRDGNISDRVYVFQNGHWRLGSKMDKALNQACMQDGIISNTTIGYMYTDEYTEEEEEWNLQGQYYFRCVVNGDTFVEGDTYSWVLDNLHTKTDEYLSECKVDGAYSHGEIIEYYVCDDGEFRNTTRIEKNLRLGCVSYNRGIQRVLDSSSYTCTSDGWTFDSVNVIVDKRNAHLYKTIKMGSQYWMAENLNLNIEDSFCYDDLEDNCETYGRLYKWEAALNACPTGWHLPSSDEFSQLEDFAGGHYDAERHLKAKEGWSYSSNVHSPDDKYGFSALAAGCYRCVQGETYTGKGQKAHFWSSSENYGKKYSVSLSYDSYYLGGGGYDNSPGLSVRCVKDD